MIKNSFTNFILRPGDIDGTCNWFTWFEDDFTAHVKFLTRFLGDEDCYGYQYKDVVEAYKNTSWDDPMNWGGRQWFYQTCAEYGWFQTSSNRSAQLFGSGYPVEFYEQMCHDIFDGMTAEELRENIDRTNVRNGGMEPNFSNVFSTHGSLDPWSAMGIQKDLNPSSPTVVIPCKFSINFRISQLI